MSRGWIGVDLDGTLAHYDHFIAPDVIGQPIPAMVNRIKLWLAFGEDVRIFTARVYCPPESDFAPDSPLHNLERVEAGRARTAITGFCLREFGRVLPITCTKDYHMRELWDDRAVQVIPNTGRRADRRDEPMPTPFEVVSAAMTGCHFERDEADKLKAYLEMCVRVSN